MYILLCILRINSCIYSIVFGHFGLCSRIKLGPRNAVFEMQITVFIFRIYELLLPLSHGLKTVFIKLTHAETKRSSGLRPFYVYNTSDVCKITYLNTSKEPKRQMIITHLCYQSLWIDIYIYPVI